MVREKEKKEVEMRGNETDWQTEKGEGGVMHEESGREGKRGARGWNEGGIVGEGGRGGVDRWPSKRGGRGEERGGNEGTADVSRNRND